MTGPEFKKALKKLGISQRKFAEQTGMSVSAINEWATGRAKLPQIAIAYLDLRLQIAEFQQKQAVDRFFAVLYDRPAQGKAE